MTEKAHVALTTPSRDTYSETFIRFHRLRLEARIEYFYKGYLPERTEFGGDIIRYNLLNRIIRKLYRLLAPGSLNPHERRLIRYFRRQNTRAVLAEFGMTGVGVMKACDRAGIPLLVHFHGADAYVEDILRLFGKQYRDLFRQAEAVFVVSRDMERQLTGLGCPPEKLVYNPYGPNDLFFSVRNHAYDSGIFLSIGRFVEKKSPQSTIKAFSGTLRRHNSAILRMVGDGPLMDTCRKLVDELGIAANVQFLGVREPEEIVQLCAEATAFVQHSCVAPNGDREGTPVAVLEAGAAGLPVIATRHAGIPDVVVEGKTGFLLEEHDILGMEEAMSRVLDNPGLAAELGQAARKHIQDNFTLQRHIDVLNHYVFKAVG